LPIRRREAAGSLSFAAWNGYRQAVHELVYPDILPAEVGHARTRAERQGRITPPNGWAAACDHG